MKRRPSSLRPRAFASTLNAEIGKRSFLVGQKNHSTLTPGVRKQQTFFTGDRFNAFQVLIKEPMTATKIRKDEDDKPPLAPLNSNSTSPNRRRHTMAVSPPRKNSSMYCNNTSETKQDNLRTPATPLSADLSRAASSSCSSEGGRKRTPHGKDEQGLLVRPMRTFQDLEND